VPKILRAFNPSTPKTLQAGSSKSVIPGSKIGRSKQQVNPPAPRVTSFQRVRRLFAADPYNKNSLKTVATFSKEADTFTDNPNKSFDPSKAPRAVQNVSVVAARTRANTPGKASRGHQKVIRRTLFNQNGGKTLRRRG
jgi:hypothetical protein